MKHVFLALLLSLSGTSAAKDKLQTGIASWYGYESGSRSANGRRFNPKALTAAHRTLPFGTRVKVQHGRRQVVVTITDRGPYVRGRILDLSLAAARALGITGLGRITLSPL